MKIPETIRKAAEEWAAKKYPTDRIPNARKSAAVEGYLACYEKLMSEGADGYTTTLGGKVYGFFNDKKEAYAKLACCIDPVAAKDLIKETDEDLVKAWQEGWSVVAVKILKMEE